MFDSCLACSPCLRFYAQKDDVVFFVCLRAFKSQNNRILKLKFICQSHIWGFGVLGFWGFVRVFDGVWGASPLSKGGLGKHSSKGGLGKYSSEGGLGKYSSKGGWASIAQKGGWASIAQKGGWASIPQKGVGQE